MQLFTPKARRLIDRAVGQVADANLRAHWMTWAAAHPETRTSQNNQHDVEALPSNAAAIALAALENVASKLKNEAYASDVSEDDLSDIQNSLAYIGTVEAVLLSAFDSTRGQRRVGA